MKNRFSSIVFVLFACFLAVTTACGYLPGGAKKDAESGQKVESDKKSDTKSNDSKDDKKSEDSKTDTTSDTKDTKDTKESDSGTPSSLPADVPFYPGGEMKTETSKNDSYKLRYTAKASTRKVADFYRTELEKKGWKIQASINVDIPGLGGSVAPLTAEKGDRTCAVATYGKNDDECDVEVAVNKK